MPTKKSYRSRMEVELKKENLTARIDGVTTPEKKRLYEIISNFLGCSRGKWVRLVLDEHIQSIDDPELLKLIKGRIPTNDKTKTEKS